VVAGMRGLRDADHAPAAAAQYSFTVSADNDRGAAKDSQSARIEKAADLELPGVTVMAHAREEVRQFQ
jgi:hypothetical protein